VRTASQHPTARSATRRATRRRTEDRACGLAQQLGALSPSARCPAASIEFGGARARPATSGSRLPDRGLALARASRDISLALDPNQPAPTTRSHRKPTASKPGRSTLPPENAVVVPTGALRPRRLVVKGRTAPLASPTGGRGNTRTDKHQPLQRQPQETHVTQVSVKPGTVQDDLQLRC
jgi:hypothetical protein